ncbi:MAG: T9SS type A sorting domain-containing protein, partial [Cytophagales bacterium]|nr:T9SS type A sorting domain-containing protein [Cytophaga sp.]
TYKTSTGTFNPRAANPGTNAINASSQVASYIRNAGTQYDLLYYSADIVSNSTEYENGKKILFMDVYTTAPVGTIINWQFENKARVAGAYPSGRRAVFVGKTTVQNQWERIKFLYNSTPDAATPVTSIDQFTFLVKPDSYTNHTYYFDNLMRRDAGNCGLAGIKDASEHHVTISPNPAHDNITISLKSVSPEPLDIIITDLLGVQVAQHLILNDSADIQESVDVSALQPGVYILYTKQQNTISSIKIIKQ